MYSDVTFECTFQYIPGDGAWFKHKCRGSNHLSLDFIPDPDGPTTIQGSQATLNITVVQKKR